MKYRIILFLVAILGVSLYGQVVTPNNPSSTLNNYGKYADIVPNLYTGAQVIPIDLAQLKEGPLSIGVSLHYHASGLRANELASSVGLGWILNCGGVITRSIRQLPDDHVNGYMNKGHLLQGTLTSTLLNQVTNGEIDGEVDIFSYNVNGMSGKFIVDHNEVVHHIPSSDVDIEYYNDGNGQHGFILQDVQGTRYTFGGSGYYESTSYRPAALSPVQNFTSSWFLKKIETHEGLHAITIHYSDHNYTYYSLQLCDGYPDGETRALEIDIASKVVSSIITSTASLHLDYTYDRQDMISGASPGAARLDKIRYNQGGLEKTP